MDGVVIGSGTASNTLTSGQTLVLGGDAAGFPLTGYLGDVVAWPVDSPQAAAGIYEMNKYGIAH